MKLGVFLSVKSIFHLIVCSPVLVSGSHLENSDSDSEKPDCSSSGEEHVLRPMRWGLIPSWYHGDVSSIEYKMNNARSDGMLVKTSFSRPLKSGRRCVVVADGFLLYVVYFASCLPWPLVWKKTRNVWGNFTAAREVSEKILSEKTVYF